MNGAPSVARYILFLAVVLEGTARILVPMPEVDGFNRVYFTPIVVDGCLHQPRSPGSSSTQARTPIFREKILWRSEPDHFEFTHTLNLYGFRGPEFSLRKSCHTPRVVFIGDSFVEGFGADDQHTIPVLVREAVGSNEIETINLGVGATGLDDYMALAKVSLPLLRPDVVVVVVYQNDLPARDIASANQPEPSEPNLAPTGVTVRSVQILEHLLNSKPIPTRFFRGPYPFFRSVPDPTNPFTGMTIDEIQQRTFAARPIIEAALQGRFNPYQVGAPQPTEDSLKVELGEHNGAMPYLSAIKGVADTVGAKMLVVYIPLHVTVSDYYYPFWNELGAHFRAPTLTGQEFRQQQRHIESCTNALGVPFLDSTPRLEQTESGGQHVYHVFDSHMNGEGYAVVARLIAAELKTQFLK